MFWFHFLLCLYCRRVIHTVGPKYAVKYHTAAENALSHCYRACLELLIENGLQRLFQIHRLNFTIIYYIYFYVIYLSLLSLGIFKCSIAMGCIYTEAKNYPREPAAHVAISNNSSSLLVYKMTKIPSLCVCVGNLLTLIFYQELFADYLRNKRIKLQVLSFV